MRLDRPLTVRLGILGLAFAAVAALSLLGVPLARAAEWTAEGSFTNDFGTRDYAVYVPSTYTGTPVPLVVMLHGCSESVEDFDADTGMTRFAERDGFVVVYPRQLPVASVSTCWNWFLPRHQQRGAGEPSFLAGITRQVMGDYAIDPGRVYIAGMSAGGAMASVMAATYPDLYAAVGIHSGLEYAAARDGLEALRVTVAGGPAPERAAALAIAAGGSHARIVPAIVFHGDADQTVDVVNGDQALRQWLLADDLADDGALNGSLAPDAISVSERRLPAGRSYTRTVFADGLLERWIVHGMGHLWSGGPSAGPYADPRGPSASEEMLRFFWQHPRPAPELRAGRSAP